MCLHKVTTQRGVSWASAMELYAQHDGDEDGFYLPKQSIVSRVMPLLAFCLRNKAGDGGDRERRKMKRLYRVYRPNTGMQSEPMEYGKLTEQYVKVSNPTDCQEHWSTIYDESATKCIHLIQRNHCNRLSVRNPQVCRNSPFFDALCPPGQLGIWYSLPSFCSFEPVLKCYKFYLALVMLYNRWCLVF